MGRNDPELRVRIPEELRDKIHAKAMENNLSLSAQVVALLSQAMEWEKWDIEGIAESVERLESKVGRLWDVVFEDEIKRNEE